jgi:NAD(P)-dependent dehydrogenase (short-subunit alcohol dehydrogenase family)
LVDFLHSKHTSGVWAPIEQLELEEWNKTINVNLTGTFLTVKYAVPLEYPQGQIPLTHGKSGTAEQVAQLVLFLASDVSNHITGTEIWIDGAQSLLNRGGEYPPLRSARIWYKIWRAQFLPKIQFLILMQDISNNWMRSLHCKRS